MKIVILDGFTTNPGDLSWAPLSALGDLEVYDRTSRTDCDLIRERLRGATVAVANKTPLTASTFAACPELRLVTLFATGYNNVETDAARAAGVAVSNVPGYSTNAVAQHAFALLLEAATHVGEHSRLVHQGVWTKENEFWYWPDPLTELAGKTLGIIGYGAIGQAVARIALAFGMEVLVTTRHPGADQPHLRFVPLPELLAAADAVSLHCPLTGENQGMIDAEALARMKPNAILVNTARGPLVRERDVVAALAADRLGYYCADVVETEPIAPDSPLLGVPRVILTPHLAWATRECRARLIQETANNIQAWLRGERRNRVE